MGMNNVVKLDDSPMDAMLKMAEGNPGAATVLAQLYGNTPAGFIDICHLDDMNIRGEQIWVAFKDHCKGDIEALREAVRARDPALVATVNQECPDRQAVTGLENL